MMFLLLKLERGHLAPTINYPYEDAHHLKRCRATGPKPSHSLARALLEPGLGLSPQA